MRGAFDDSPLRHVDDADEPLGGVDLRGVLAEEEEDAESVTLFQCRRVVVRTC